MARRESCCRFQVLFDSKIVNCSEEETFGNLISRSEEKQFSKRVGKVNIKAIAMKCSLTLH